MISTETIFKRILKNLVKKSVALNCQLGLIYY